MARTQFKYIAPKSLGSGSDRIWTRKNYTIEHWVGYSDLDSRYEGVFFGYPFSAELYGVDGANYMHVSTDTPRYEKVMDDILDNSPEALEEGEEEEAAFPEPKKSNMPEEMKEQLAIALITHHVAAYNKWASEQKEEEYYYW